MTQRYRNMPPGSTHLPDVVSPLLDKILAQYQNRWQGHNEDIFDYMVEQGLTYLQTSPSFQPVVSGRSNISANTILTGPNTALAVYGIMLDMDTAANNSGDVVCDIEYDVSYYQPSPPAANTTTDASFDGNLSVRNKLLVGSMTIERLTVTSGGHTQTQGMKIHRWFRRPPLIVGSALTVNTDTFLWTGAIANLSTRANAQIYYKYVPITTDQYVNLVALATGQAILPPTIFG